MYNIYVCIHVRGSPIVIYAKKIHRTSPNGVGVGVVVVCVYARGRMRLVLCAGLQFIKGQRTGTTRICNKLTLHSVYINRCWPPLVQVNPI